MTTVAGQCPRCHYPNAPDVNHCLKCHATLGEARQDFEDDARERSPLPWVIGGFALIFVIGLALTARKPAAAPRPVTSASLAMDSAPPPEEPTIIASNAPLPGGSAPVAPGAHSHVKFDWKTVASLRGTGAQRTRSFVIRSRYWRLRWRSSTDGAEEWYGPGSNFKAQIRRNSGEMIGVILNRQGQFTGTSRFEERGAFCVDVSAGSAWTVDVEEWS
jgi:hypothetical protein